MDMPIVCGQPLQGVAVVGAAAQPRISLLDSLRQGRCWFCLMHGLTS